MLGLLPTSLQVAGKQYNIQTDYRNILRIITAYTDKELTDSEKVYICMRRLYGEDFYKIPSDDYEEAIKQANLFIENGEHEDRPGQRIYLYARRRRIYIYFLSGNGCRRKKHVDKLRCFGELVWQIEWSQRKLLYHVGFQSAAINGRYRKRTGNYRSIPVP